MRDGPSTQEFNGDLFLAGFFSCSAHSPRIHFWIAAKK